MSISIQSNIYEFKCPKCRKNYQAECNPNYISNPINETIECICGRKISIILLRYLYKSRNKKKIFEYEIL